MPEDFRFSGPVCNGTTPATTRNLVERLASTAQHSHDVLLAMSSRVTEAALTAEPPIPFDGVYKQQVGSGYPDGWAKKQRLSVYEMKSGWLLDSDWSYGSRGGWNRRITEDVSGSVLCVSGLIYSVANSRNIRNVLDTKSLDAEFERVQVLNGAELRPIGLPRNDEPERSWNRDMLYERIADDQFQSYADMLTRFIDRHDLAARLNDSSL